MRCWWAVLFLTGCVGDQDPPELLDFKPVDGTDLSGVADVTAWAVYRDESAVTTRMFVDAEFVGDDNAPRCGESTCQAGIDFSSLDLAPGPHDLTVSLEDDAGNVTTQTHTILIDDVLTITSMRVSNISDTSGLLEIEVYAFDESNTMIGCAGSRHGLATVDNPGLTYDLSAVLIDPGSLAFGTLDAADKRFRLEVWEDDDDPVCPAYLDPTLNDFVGRSPMYTAQEWRSMPLMSFDNVSQLGVAWGRPLMQGDDVDPAPQRPPSLFDDSDGCSAARGSAGGLCVLGALGLVVGRRCRRR